MLTQLLFEKQVQCTSQTAAAVAVPMHFELFYLVYGVLLLYSTIHCICMALQQQPHLYIFMHYIQCIVYAHSFKAAKRVNKIAKTNKKKGEKRKKERNERACE
jgi:hypothetical protein